MVDAILDATARVLIDDGYDKATTNRIAEVAGVSVGSVYQYFTSKEAIVLSLVKRHTQAMLGLLEQMATGLSDAPLAVAVRAYVRAMLAAHAVEPELHRVLIHQVLHLDPGHVREMEQRAQAIVEAYLEQHRHEIGPRRLDVAAFVLVTTVEAITHTAALERPAFLVDAAALEEEICAVVLGYLAVPVERAAQARAAAMPAAGKATRARRELA